MVKNLVDLLIESEAVKFGEFILVSGKKSNYYIDIKQASTDPKILRIIAKMMKKFAEDYDLIAGMELGAVPIAVALSLESGKPFVIVRKEEKSHGTKKQIEGKDVKDKRVLIVEDVTTTGGSVVKAVKVLRESGAIVDKVLAVVDREEGAKERLDVEGIKLIPLVTKSEILKKC